MHLMQRNELKPMIKSNATIFCRPPEIPVGFLFDSLFLFI